jgi:hypothetical protein
MVQQVRLFWVKKYSEYPITHSHLINYINNLATAGDAFAASIAGGAGPNCQSKIFKPEETKACEIARKK